MQFEFLQNQGVQQQSILRDYCTQSAARKDPLQFVPSSYDNVCSYSHKQLFSALLVLSDTSCVDSDSISLPRSTLLCHYLENIVYPALPQCTAVVVTIYSALHK